MRVPRIFLKWADETRPFCVMNFTVPPNYRDLQGAQGFFQILDWETFPYSWGSGHTICHLAQDMEGFAFHSQNQVSLIDLGSNGGPRSEGSLSSYQGTICDIVFEEQSPPRAFGPPALSEMDIWNSALRSTASISPLERRLSPPKGTCCLSLVEMPRISKYYYKWIFNKIIKGIFPTQSELITAIFPNTAVQLF